MSDAKKPQPAQKKKKAGRTHRGIVRDRVADTIHRDAHTERMGQSETELPNRRSEKRLGNRGGNPFEISGLVA